MTKVQIQEMVTAVNSAGLERLLMTCQFAELKYAMAYACYTDNAQAVRVLLKLGVDTSFCEYLPWKLASGAGFCAWMILQNNYNTKPDLAEPPAVKVVDLWAEDFLEKIQSWCRCNSWGAAWHDFDKWYDKDYNRLSL